MWSTCVRLYALASHSLVHLLSLIVAETAWPDDDEDQEAADDGHGLEEVVFLEVVHDRGGSVFPEVVEDEVKTHEPDDHDDRHEFGLEADGDQDDHGDADDVSDDFERFHVEMEQRYEHQH